MPSQNERAYTAFITAVSKGNTGVAQRYVAPGFRATLHETLAADLTFQELINELGRQRLAFSNLGDHIRVVQVHEDPDEPTKLVITYEMTVTFDGTLHSRDGRRSYPPNNRQVKIPSQARVEFDTNGKIIVLEVVTDMVHTVQQMF